MTIPESVKPFCRHLVEWMPESLRNNVLEVAYRTELHAMHQAGVDFQILERPQFLVPTSDPLTQTTGLDADGAYEIMMSAAFVSNLCPGAVVFDIGAAAGFYSLLAAKRIPAASIHGFEPDPFKFFLLRKNNLRFCEGGLRMVRKFVSDHTAGNCIALDDYCAETGVRPTVIKIDIEGAEFLALRGMQRTLREARPVILLEFHIHYLRQNFNTDPQQVVDLLSGCGYRVRFNHHHDYLWQNNLAPDRSWHEEFPKANIAAILAEPVENAARAAGTA